MRDLLLERDERYERLIELAADGMLIHDGERITAVNAATMRLAGATTREQLVGQPIHLVLRPPYLRAVEDRLTGARASTQMAPAVRDIFHRLDGEEIPVEIRAQMFLVHGQPSAYLTIRDISERLNVEAEARAVAERLQTAQRLESVGALAGGVAHEVNNMLQVILGFGGMLLDEPHASEAARADAREIVRAATQAAAITRQLLEYSRHGVHRPTAVDLCLAIGELESVMRRLLGENRRLLVELHPCPTASMDRGQLEQVLVNLLLNARHATSDEGRIVVRTGVQTVDTIQRAADGAEIPRGIYATLSVRDNGTGMSSMTRSRIFEPFFTTKGSEQGTGLGLAAVQGIMAQNGGFILVSSALNSGTTMTLLWPKASRPGEPDEWAADASASTARSTTSDEHAEMAAGLAATARADWILVVDDEPSVRAVARRILERGGYTVRESPNGLDALGQIIRDGLPSLVLSDMRMPGMGGVELARRLLERWPALPILLMSGYAADAMDATTATSVVVSHIEKPFTVDALLARVHALLTPHAHS